MSLSESDSPQSLDANAGPALDWKPLTRNQRRVLGVLIEKSKTTPDVYPMSINGIKTGSNQKTNRSPILDLNEHQVEETLYELRHLGAVIEVHASGRVPKYKHQAYDWLAVDKPELGVLAELLLRGEQSIGDLRARSARMEKSIGGLEELRPILASLKQKRLLVELTPPGRGQTVTHNLYRPEELDQLRQQFATGCEIASDDDDFDDAESNAGSAAPLAKPKTTTDRLPSNDHQDVAKIENLQDRVDRLESAVTELNQRIEDLKQLILN